MPLPVRDDARTTALELAKEATKLFEQDPNKARLLYENAIKKDPNNWSVYDSLGNLLLKQGLPDEAIELAARCLHNYRESPYCHDIMIKAYEALGNDEQQRYWIGECKEWRGGDYFCLQKERDYLLKHGDSEGARLAVEKAFEHGDEAQKQETLTRFYMFTGEIKLAKQAADRACKLGDQDSCDRMKNENWWQR